MLLLRMLGKGDLPRLRLTHVAVRRRPLWNRWQRDRSGLKCIGLDRTSGVAKCYTLLVRNYAVSYAGEGMRAPVRCRIIRSLWHRASLS